MESTAEQPLDVLYVSPERFRAKPQIGVACEMNWHQLALYLSRPSVGESKDEAGAYSPALYHDNVRRKASLVRIGALIADIDQNGDVDSVAETIGKYAAIVHETFSSTNDAPRCRAVLLLAEPVDAGTYELTHAIVRTHLRCVGILADDGAKDASRLSYAPVRRAGAGYRFRVVDGKPLDAKAVIAAQPPKPQHVPKPLPRPEHRDAYIRGALDRAAGEVASANAGIRHYTLSKEAFGLARLGISDSEIESALLPAFVEVAGDCRQYEGERTIRDAIRARRGGA